MLRLGVILSLLLSLAGGAVGVAANNSLADLPLCATKPGLEEQVQLSLMSDLVKIASRHLVRAENLVQEMIRMAVAGEVPQVGIRLRLEQHLNMALQLAARLNDQNMKGVLTLTRNMVQNQIRQLTQTREQVGTQAQEPLRLTIQVLNRIQERLQAGEQGPDGFRSQYRHGSETELAEPTLPDIQENCIPMGAEHKYGQEDYQPGSKLRYQDCEDCTPEGEEYKYGQDENHPDPPHQNRNCIDCEPVGDQNQYGK